MQRCCDFCKAEFSANRSSARYCSSSCRSKATVERQRLGAVVEMPAKRKRGAGSPPVAAGVAVTVEKQLAGARKLDTYAGQQALVLARRLDGSAVDSGAAVAALSKELDRLMVDLLAGTEEPDELDGIQGKVLEMRSRRRG